MVQVGDMVVIKSARVKMPYRVERISLDGTTAYVRNLKYYTCYHWSIFDLRKFSVSQPELF